MRVVHIVGARPNFMKAAPVIRAFNGYPTVKQTLIHTGQHYDANMSEVFFNQLEIPTPDANLEVGSSSHARQTAEVMCRLEAILPDHNPDIVVVYGDVNSTVAAAMVCAKLPIPIAHVEAGLRSFDRNMPEEVNRIVTDHLSDLLFTHSEDAENNLRREGIPSRKIHAVGNVMIDSLIRSLPAARQVPKNGFQSPFALVTLHRPSNVDNSAMLSEIVQSLCEIAERLQVVFPVHPRTRGRIAELAVAHNNIHFLEPLSYLEFLALQCRAAVVITDSGGIQEETTYLGVPCLTLRENTERPVTVTCGTNTLVGRDPSRLLSELRHIVEGRVKKGSVPPLWDGRSGERIARSILNQYRPQGSVPSASYVLPATVTGLGSHSEG